MNGSVSTILNNITCIKLNENGRKYFIKIFKKRINLFGHHMRNLYTFQFLYMNQNKKWFEMQELDMNTALTSEAQMSVVRSIQYLTFGLQQNINNVSLPTK